jgi:hypothetical protein
MILKQEKDSVRDSLPAALMILRDRQNSGQRVDMETSSFCKSLINGAPYGITRPSASPLRGRRRQGLRRSNRPDGRFVEPVLGR